MKKLLITFLFGIFLTGICFAQSSMFRNFHQQGKATAEMNSDEIVMAHPSLPIGTKIKVTNTGNGKEVIATVNSRISASTDRIVDLSKKAATELGLTDGDTTPVRLEIAVPPPQPKPVPLPVVEEPVLIAEEEVLEEAPPEEPPPEEIAEEEPLPPEEIAGGEPLPPPPEPEPEPEKAPPAEEPHLAETPAPAPSPNIVIYNTIMSPGSFQTDSTTNSRTNEKDPPAPVNPPPPQAPAPAPAIAQNNTSIQVAPVQVQTPPPEEPPVEIPAQLVLVPVAPPIQPAPAPVQAPPQPVPVPVRAIPAPLPALKPLKLDLSLPPAIVGPQMPDPANGKLYRVQVGSFEDTRNAKNAFDRVALARYHPAYEIFENYYRVVIAKVRSSEMHEVARWLGYAGFKEILIREE